MRRYEIYIDNNGKLCLAEFKNHYDKYESKILKGVDTYEKIKKISMGKILNAKNNRIDIMVQYKDYILNMNEYQKLVEKRGMAPIVNNLKNYYEKEKILKIKHKKVTRKKKHTGKKILAGTLVIAMLGCCAYKLEVENKSVIDLPTPPSISNAIINAEKNFNNIKIEEDKGIIISLDYENNSLTQKAINAKENYSQLITKYAKMYGIDPKLALAIATQERGMHSNVMDTGGATGLMQIQNSVWVEEQVSAYNFETKKIETFKITKNNIGDLEYNIKIGCMILQNTFQYMNHNIPAAIQCYNMGYGNMKIILNAYAKSQNKTIDEILSDPSDLGWLEYRNLITVGDLQYLEHVLSWIGDEINIKNVKPNGELVELSISNELETKKVY